MFFSPILTQSLLCESQFQSSKSHQLTASAKLCFRILTHFYRSMSPVQSVVGAGLESSKVLMKFWVKFGALEVDVGAKCLFFFLFLFSCRVVFVGEACVCELRRFLDWIKCLCSGLLHCFGYTILFRYVHFEQIVIICNLILILQNVEGLICSC